MTILPALLRHLLLVLALLLAPVLIGPGASAHGAMPRQRTACPHGMADGPMVSAPARIAAAHHPGPAHSGSTHACCDQGGCVAGLCASGCALHCGMGIAATAALTDAGLQPVPGSGDWPHTAQRPPPGLSHSPPLGPPRPARMV